jgi:hypothetical protein
MWRLLLLSMGGSDSEENLRFEMHFIKESHTSKHCLMHLITIRNEPLGRQNLEERHPFCYKEFVCPGASRAPPPKGSSFGSRWLP